MLFCVLVLSTLAFAKFMAPPLDQKRVHFAYKDGDFDIVSQELEKYARDFKGRKWLREDSIFLYKHLAVVYTASPETREKGKYFIISMLRIMPSAEILDMYVSEEVDRIFLRTRQEFLANMKMFAVDTSSIKIPTARPLGKGVAYQDSANGSGNLKSKESKGGVGWWWAAGGMTLVAAGAATYFVMQDDEPKVEYKVIPVPSQE